MFRDVTVAPMAFLTLVDLLAGPAPDTSAVPNHPQPFPQDPIMTPSLRSLVTGSLLALSIALPMQAQARDNGVLRVKSAYSMEESIARVKADIAAKGITFFNEIDQTALAAKNGIALRRSTLLEFGNPALGTQFITGNPDAGLDWPVRLLFTQDDGGQVWAVWTDFAWIAQRHGITSRDAQFNMATQVVRSITSTLKPAP
jgi:uncharacterized protein (DUF302 family)